MTVFIVIAIIAFAVFLALGISGNNIQSKFEKDEISDLTSNGFDLSTRDKLFKGIICIDQKNKKLILIQSQITVKKTFIINYEDILSCELIKDGQIVAKKSTIRTIGGAVIGGVLAGGAGAIVGGLSGTSKSSSKADKIDLKIVVRNLSIPNYTFTFFDRTTDNSALYNELSEKAESWKDKISIIIDMVDKEQTKKPSEEQTINTKSSSDIVSQIEKLHSLKEKGILTEEEFQTQKEKILKQ